MKTLTLLHTADVHKATFDALRDRIAPNVALTHIVRPDWLETARNQGITEALRQEIAQVVSAAPEVVLCSCTSIGSIAEHAGAIRVDRPMMELAASTAGPILLAYALESTAKPSLELLKEACIAKGHSGAIIPLLVPDVWSLFETEQKERFYSAIAKAISDKLREVPEITSVVLAQASMAPVGDLLTGLPPKVLNSPEAAFRAALAS